MDLIGVNQAAKARSQLWIERHLHGIDDIVGCHRRAVLELCVAQVEYPRRGIGMIQAFCQTRLRLRFRVQFDQAIEQQIVNAIRRGVAHDARIQHRGIDISADAQRTCARTAAQLRMIANTRPAVAMRSLMMMYRSPLAEGV